MSRGTLVATLMAGMWMLPMTVSAAHIAEVRGAASEIRFEALVEHAGGVLTVETPGGDVLRFESARGVLTFGLFDADGQVRPDGIYRWELRLMPRPSVGPREPMHAAQSRDEGAAIAQQRRNELGPDLVQSGSFRIAGGAFLDDEELEQLHRSVVADAVRVAAAPTQVINDDLQVNGWMLLRDDDLRIRFDDTGPLGFPANDWQLTANEFSGQNKFSIEDITGGTVPFTVLAGAPSNSLVVSGFGRTGRVGLGTSVPERTLHIRTDSLPVVRLEDTNRFPWQKWDIYGNSTSFGVIDSTNFTLPFHVYAGAPSYSLLVAPDGNVAIGTFPPTARLHVRSNGSGTTDGKVLIDNISPTVAGRELLELHNENGQAVMVFKDTTEAERWANGTFSTSFVVNNQANPGVEFTFGNTGNFTAAGTITPGSSRSVKEAFAAVEPREILTRVLALPITTWSYKADPAVRHIGPMAEDFFAAFAVGADAKGISVTDSAGVALAAIQALHQELIAKEAQIAALHERLAALEATSASPAGN